VIAHDKRLIELERDAIDVAYRDHVMLLFKNWLIDSHDQPQRAINGLKHARDCYREAMTAIEQREHKQ